MAEVMNAPVDNLDRRRDRSNNNNNTEAANTSKSPDGGGSSPAFPPLPPQLQARRGRDRKRDLREWLDDREFDRRGRDYYDRNRSPPPPPRERDYNKRGRPNHSPPPPPYCDRRVGGHSPPARRSPPFPPYKRERRDDYDGKLGSPRGGYGPGDRRFYDYQARYNREMGGRPSYVDERFHGRFFGRSSGGNQDWHSGHGVVVDGFGAGGTQREGLMSYKQFVQELDDDILPSEAEGRYQEYKSEYVSTQKRTYFDTHKYEEWLKDNYHPTNLLSVIERRNEAARKLAKNFLLDLQSGTLDLGPGFNASSTNKSGQSSDPNFVEELDIDMKRKPHGRWPAKKTDLLSAAPRAPLVSSKPWRMQIDIEQAQALVRKLDSEKGIEDNLLCRADNETVNRDKSHGGSTGPVNIIQGLTSVKSLEGIELLDTLMTYLWRIHGVDYYGMLESSEAKGLRRVRVDGKNLNATNNGSEWEKKLDLRWQERLKGQDPLEVMTAKEKINATAVEALDLYVRKIGDEKYGWKYGCGAKGCTKLFHAAEFVHNHLKLKHPELVMELTSKVREDLYFQNYMNDENAPGGTPIMQPSILKEKPPRHRPGLNNQLKDERGSRREHENQANGERFDRSKNSQQGDFQSNNDGTAGVNHDEPMFGTFGGQGILVAPFPSDIPPPPVLLSVPGAGPLGPFVPAPPEVAMRMLREQGGPSPSAGGRNGRLGPQLGGLAPIIARTPAFRLDPRRLRSYQDRDAPEDEVTVIDYRSL